MQGGRIRSNALGWQSIRLSGDIESVPGATSRVYSRDLCLVATQSTGLRSTADLWHPATLAVVGVLWKIDDLCHPRGRNAGERLSDVSDKLAAAPKTNVTILHAKALGLK